MYQFSQLAFFCFLGIFFCTLPLTKQWMSFALLTLTGFASPYPRENTFFFSALSILESPETLCQIFLFR